MPVSREFWRRHPLYRFIFSILWGSVAISWSIGVVLNGGIGKLRAPTVTPSNNPAAFWLAVLGSALAGIVAIGYGVRQLQYVEGADKDPDSGP